MIGVQGSAHIHPGILPDAENQTGDDADRKKEAQFAIPWYLTTVPHVLQDGDDQIGQPGNEGGRLQDLPAGALQRTQQITAEPHIKQEIEERRQRKTNLFLDIFHMNPLRAFLFPDTDICTETRYPLMLAGRLSFLQPIEADPKDSEANEPDLFIKRGLCQAHTPAPLGADRQRFRRLVDDIKYRRDDYAAQLSALTMAGLSAPRTEKSGESRLQILSSLLSEHGMGTTDRSPGNATELWQARLVLAIAEILDQEEEMLLRDLQVLDEREWEMLRSLHGDDEDTDEENPLAELERLRARLGTTRPTAFRTRFQAWLKMMQSAPAPDVDVWIAGSSDAADQIFELSEKNGAGAAPPLISLPLPRYIDASPKYVAEQIGQFHDEATALYDALSSDLQRVRNDDYHEPIDAALLLPSAGPWIDEWQTLVDKHFPAGSHGRTGLRFYVLRDTSVETVLGLHAATHHPARHGLLAVLTPEAAPR